MAERYIEQGLLKNDGGARYKECLKLDGKYAACHFGLFQLYNEAHQAKAAQIACKNFVKFAGAESSPRSWRRVRSSSAQSY